MQDNTHFGFDTVPLDQKQARVDAVFEQVAARYDLMNDVMSAGLHRAWKASLITALRPPRNKAFKVLDVAGGTGDIAFRALKAGGPQTHVTVLDINGEMLKVGFERAAQRLTAEEQSRIDFVEANAENLPFPDKSFDAYTIAFGIRNVPRIARALSEAHRVLKTGGRFFCLEFSHVDVPGFDKMYDLYSFHIIPSMGAMIAGDADAYRYLVESIRRFPRAQAFANMIEAAGFRHVTHKIMSGGIVALHMGWKV
jgi:demethylmenaquinone methyltransferase / 2-methoxy-6-polyprenyl-1,4-benzoquinol methylase